MGSSYRKLWAGTLATVVVLVSVAVLSSCTPEGNNIPDGG